MATNHKHWTQKRVSEGKELPEFWNLFENTNSREYATAECLLHKPQWVRAFVCYPSHSSLQVEPLQYLTQEDLTEDRIIIVDAFYHIFIWVGQRKRTTNSGDVVTATKAVEEYQRATATARSVTPPVTVCHAGAESLLFKAHFFSWKQWPTNTVLIKDTPSKPAPSENNPVIVRLH